MTDALGAGGRDADGRRGRGRGGDIGRGGELGGDLPTRRARRASQLTAPWVR